MTIFRGVVVVALAVACHKADGGGGTLSSSGASSATRTKLTSLLPSGAFAIGGYNRDASESDMKGLFQLASTAMAGQPGAPKIPPCVGEVVAKIDSGSRRT